MQNSWFSMSYNRATQAEATELAVLIGNMNIVWLRRKMKEGRKRTQKNAKEALIDGVQGSACSFVDTTWHCFHSSSVFVHLFFVHHLFFIICFSFICFRSLYGNLIPFPLLQKGLFSSFLFCSIMENSSFVCSIMYKVFQILLKP